MKSSLVQLCLTVCFFFFCFPWMFPSIFYFVGSALDDRWILSCFYFKVFVLDTQFCFRLTMRKLFSFFYTNYPGESADTDSGCSFFLILLFDLKIEWLHRKDKNDSISMLSEVQSSCISQGKKLPGSQGWMLTDVFSIYKAKPALFAGLSFHLSNFYSGRE